jgi:hypothetical protein
MYKNIVIIILVFLLCSLLFQNKQNVDILVENMADTTETIVDGTIYLKKSFKDSFGDKDFTIDIDIPSAQIQKEPFSEGSGIQEDTFFNEEEK